MKIIIASILLAPFYLVIVVLQIAIVFIEIAIFFCAKIFKNPEVNIYTYKQIVSTDQTINALLAGDEDETISGRVGRRIPNSWFAKLLNKIYFWQKNHVVEAVEPDEGKDDLIK